jgi:hypothetical protein
LWIYFDTVKRGTALLTLVPCGGAVSIEDSNNIGTPAIPGESSTNGRYLIYIIREEHIKR